MLSCPTHKTYCEFQQQSVLPYFLDSEPSTYVIRSLRLYNRIIPKRRVRLRTQQRGLIGRVLSLPSVIFNFRPSPLGTVVTNFAGRILKIGHFRDLIWRITWRSE